MFRDPKTPLTEEQHLLRKQVLHQIESEPHTLDMSAWENDNPACGTTRCLAGWAVYLTTGQTVKWSAETGIVLRAVSLLGLTREEYGGDCWLLVTESDDVWLFYDMNDARALRRFRALTECPHYEGKEA